MAYLIYGNTIKQEKVITPVTSMYVEAGHQFRSCSYSGKKLEGLYHIRGAQQCESPVECLTVDSCKTSLGSVEIAVNIGSYPGSRQSVKKSFRVDAHIDVLQSGFECTHCNVFAL